MYSQYEEERHILASFRDHVGRFLDIGAWDGRTFSNTLALAERGWSGVLIEPSPDCFPALLKLHGDNPKMTLIHAALGFERCMHRFWNTADAVSTLSEKSYGAWKDHATFTGSFYVPVFTLKELFNQFGGGFDFVNIDAEGISVELFIELLKTGAIPSVVCIEHDGRIQEILQHGQKAGYKATHTNGTNVILSL